MLTSDLGGAVRRTPPYFLLCGAVSLLAAGLLTYSQTLAFAWDEGFHLLAAQSILHGKRPYADFLFSQTPLNAYWNAFWMGLFGDTWRTAHAVAALCTAASVMLMADCLFTRFPLPRWRTAAALAAVCVIGLNVLIVEFGTIGQAYGFCLLLLTAAFRAAILAPGRKGPLAAFAAGLFSGAAAASSLLTAPAAPVLLLWILRYNRTGRRAAKCAGFIAGVVAAFLPLLRLAAIAPRNVLFGVVEYNFLYRGVHWTTASDHNLAVLLSWIDSSHALLLIFLAAAGLSFVVFRSGWTGAQRAEYYLCGWLVLALGAHIATARPTFGRYYLLVVPFAGMLAVAGLYWLAARLYAPDRPYPPLLVLAALLSFGQAKLLYEARDGFRWTDVETIARKVNEVTPPGRPIFADEPVYFVAGRTPPSGMELMDSHKLEFPADRAAAQHVVPGSEVARRIRAGEFATVESCEDDEGVPADGLDAVYAHKAEFDDCVVRWGRVPVARVDSR